MNKSSAAKIIEVMDECGIDEMNFSKSYDGYTVHTTIQRDQADEELKG